MIAKIRYHFAALLNGGDSILEMKGMWNKKEKKLKGEKRLVTRKGWSRVALWCYVFDGVDRCFWSLW